MEQFHLPVTHIGTVTTLDSSTLQKTQRELKELIEIVRGDIDRIIERESRLQNLTARADEMEVGARQFSRRAIQIRRNMWWRSIHSVMAIVVTCMLFIVGIIVFSINMKNDNDS